MRGDAETLQIIQPPHQTLEIAYAIAIRIHKGRNGEAVHNRVFVPEIVNHAIKLSVCELTLRSIDEMQELTWWQHGIVYEIYSRSFQDSDGDGIGDLNGILQRLDYLVELGIDAIWLSPIYLSPMADFGYDVADYCDVDPIFGTLDDFDRLLREVHCRGLKMILDFVPNHTSDQHPWFLESRSSRENPKRDWYLWRDEPNNWLSNFGGSGWEWDETTKQCYYHSFLKEQPDLNWRKPAVQEAMFDVLRFWLQRGVDGFRVDVMWLIIKDEQFRDNPPNPGYHPGSRRTIGSYPCTTRIGLRFTSW